MLDTNIIISAFINSQGKPARIVRMIFNRKATMCYNSAILSEYESVAARPKFVKHINPDSVRRVIEIIRSIGISAVSIPGNIQFTDESDRVFYDTAKACEAYLVTGNLKHYPKEQFIMSPADFLTAVKEE